MKFLGKIFAHLWQFSAVQRALKKDVYGHLYNTEGDLYMGRWSVVAGGSIASRCLSLCTRGKYDHVRLHWIRRADADRELHNHPFNYRTFILQGGYREEYLPDGTMISLARSLNSGDTVESPLGHYHRITRVWQGGVWTLFCMGKDNGGWGFLVDGKHMPSREFFAYRNIKNDGKAA